MQDIDRVYEEAKGSPVHLLQVSGRDNIFVTIGSTALEAEILRGDVLTTSLGRGQGTGLHHESPVAGGRGSGCDRTGGGTGALTPLPWQAGG